MKTDEACTPDVICATPGDTLWEAARKMRAHHVGCVVVVDPDGKPLGIVTDRDIVVEAVAAGIDPATLTVGEVMSRDPVTIEAGAELGWALKVMRDRGVRRLPVVDGSGRACGLVALDDILLQSATMLADVAQTVGTGRLAESYRRTPLR